MLIIREKNKIKGEVEIIKFRDNKIIERKKYHNLITNAGKYFIGQVLCKLTDDFIYYIGIGTGTTDVSADDTSIEEEILLKPYAEVSITSNQAVFTFFIEKSEAIGDWGNIGLLTYDKTLVSHLNIAETKTQSDYILINYKLGG